MGIPDLSAFGIGSTKAPDPLTDKQSLRIFDPSGNPIVNTRLPGEITLGLRSDYRKFAEGGAGNTLKTILGAMGISLSFKWMELALWEKTDNLKFNIPIELIAYSSAYHDVMLPVLNLLGAASPRVTPVGLIIPPGPDILEMLASHIDRLIDRGIFGSADRIQEGEHKGELENDYLEAARRELHQLNLFKYVSSWRRNQGWYGHIGRTITIEFGHLLKFKEMVIENIQIIFGDGDSTTIPLNSYGQPLKAIVQLEVSGSKVWTRDSVGDSYSSHEQYSYVYEKVFGKNYDQVIRTREKEADIKRAYKNADDVLNEQKVLTQQAAGEKMGHMMARLNGGV